MVQGQYTLGTLSPLTLLSVLGLRQYFEYGATSASLFGGGMGIHRV